MAKPTGLDNYVEVNVRIEKFYKTYPDGAIRTSIEGDRPDKIIVRAEVYSDKYDENPVGVGHSWLEVPGSTPYTKGSELENAETSAVGRAIANAGFEVHKSVASVEEIAMHSAIAEEPKPIKRRTRSARTEARAIAQEIYGTDGWKEGLANDLAIADIATATDEELQAWIADHRDAADNPAGDTTVA